MKKRIKRMIVVLGITVTLVGSSMSVLAASCLNVRDYGCHRFNHRVESITRSGVAMGQTSKGVHVVVTETTTGFCVCGLRGTDTRVYDEYVK